MDAAKQIIFSLGPACGCVITLSSYNQFNRDCQKDAVVIAIANGLTSLFSGCVVFAILGYMAHEANKSVFEVVKVGSYCTTYRKVASSNVSRFVTRLVYNHTQNDNFLNRSLS